MAVIAVTVLAGAPVGAHAQLHAPAPSVSGTPTASDSPSGSVGSIEEALAEDLRRFGWPLLVGVMVVAFLGFQSRSERHERKLADAPLDQGERLRFK